MAAGGSQVGQRSEDPSRGQVAAYDSIWADVTALALDEAQSKELIGEVTEEYGGS
jgi:hypothetical protein